MQLTTYHFNIMETRICTKCGEEKPETTEYFCKNKASRGGLNSTCKVCCRKRTRKWHAENPEKSSENARRWRAENPEKAREAVRRWRAENPEKAREAARRWKAENPEKESKRQIRWKAENPEKAKEAARRRRNTLAPNYLKNLIANKHGISHSEIGDELINAKRREITYYRQLTQLKK